MIKRYQAGTTIKQGAAEYEIWTNKPSGSFVCEERALRFDVAMSLSMEDALRERPDRYASPVDDAVVKMELDAAEASKVAEVLLHLAALIEPDDPDGA